VYIEAVNLRPHCSLQQCANSYLSWNFTCHTRGRVRAGPSLQLGTLSTRIALYTRRWRASPGVLIRTRIILSALSRLSWRAYACRPCYALHTFSGLTALCRVPKTRLIGRPVPEIWPNLTRTDTRRATDTTYQPTNQPASQPAVLPVPSCKLGNIAIFSNMENHQCQVRRSYC